MPMQGKALVLLAMVAAAASKEVTISNMEYRYNVSGEIMDAHDGSYNQWEPGGPWYCAL